MKSLWNYVMYYGISIIVYYISRYDQTSEEKLKLKAFFTLNIKFAIFITWFLSHFLVLPFHEILYTSNFRINIFLILQVFFGILGGLIQELPETSNKKRQRFSVAYQRYLIFESIVFITVLTLIICFFKNVYESLGPVYEDIFLKLIAQGKEYKNAYEIIFFIPYQIFIYKFRTHDTVYNNLL